MEFSIDYCGLLASFGSGTLESKQALLMEELPYVWRDSYLLMTPRETGISLIRFGSFEYIYDDLATLEATGQMEASPAFESRLVAVLGHSRRQDGGRDDYRLKGWVGPTETVFGKEWDKGHFMAHSIGGAVDQCEMNVFVQLRELNRGWSEAGKRFRVMEEYCLLHPGTFCFNRPIYGDGSARPTAVDFGLLRKDGELWVERFENR